MKKNISNLLYMLVALLSFLVSCGSSGDSPYNGHKYVDLGLPSGIKWATCNVGASAPEEFGGYYAWGETDEKDEFSTISAVCTILGQCCRTAITPFVGTVDNKTVLDPQDDVAHVYANFNSVTSPLNFDQDRLERDNVVIDRLIDIRTAQVEFRAQNGRYAANFDELIAFLDDSMNVVNKTYILNDDQLVEVRKFKVEDTKPKNADEMSFSEDEADQIVLNIIKDTNKKNLKKNAKRIEKLDALYRRDTTWVVKNDTLENGKVVEVKEAIVDDTKIAETFRRDTTRLAYVDTLFHNSNYDIQQLRFIPFSKDENGNPIEFFMQADSIQTNAQANRKAGGYIQVFEARADFVDYLKGLNEQELNNYLLNVITNGTEFREVDRVDTKGNPLRDANDAILKRRIPCRKVGDITKNNNNAGNWPNR